MAQVWLSRRDCVEGTLPRLCLKCGEPAGECVEKELAGTLLWGAPVAWLMSACGESQGAKLRLPMCPKHLDYWQRRRRWLCSAFVGLGLWGVGLTGWLLLEESFPTFIKDWLVVLLVVGFLSLVCAFYVVLIYALFGIRATEIHEGGVWLFGVSLKFAHTHEGEHFLGDVDVDEALDRYARRPRRRSKDVTDEP